MKMSEMGIPEDKSQESVEWYIQNCDGFQTEIEKFIKEEIVKKEPDYLAIKNALYDLGKLKTVSYLKKNDLIEYVDKIL